MELKKGIRKIVRAAKYKLLYRFVVTVIEISNVMPQRVWLSLCGSLGNLLFYVVPSIGKQIERNLTSAFKNEKSSAEIHALAKQVVVMLVKNAGVVLREFLISRDGFYKQTIVRGAEHAEKAFLSGRGVIFLTAHIGPFECLAHELSISGYHPYIIGTPLKDAMLNELVNSNRTKFGAVVIERGKETYRVMKNIMAGGTMAILIDQDTSVKSVFVNFFGKPCSTPAGAALIALKTGAAVVPVFSHLNKEGQHEIEYYREVNLQTTGNDREDIVTNTQTLTTIIENQIRRFPEQWVWMHRRWKTQMQASTRLPEKSTTAIA
ncbi:MAG TPA: lysophospholipid acyltransferase family protein [Chryseolinea sp.]|nr:lysophospholipid acyltransferase family protein [Chryseolinea sp.]